MGNKIDALKQGWYVWLFPLFAVLISCWLVFDYYRQQGPVIHILFDDAAGIQAAKTTVRFRGVSVGTVRDVYLSEDRKDVVAEVLLRKDSAGLPVEGSKFSLITPQVNLQGISGLETLFEGTYISVLPGPAKGKQKHEFKAQNSTNSTDPLDDTSAYMIETPNVESLSPGDSLTYRGLKVGSVTKLVLTKDSQTILIHINVENRYTKLIRTNTAFWNKVGVQAKLGLFNSEIKVNSMDSILNGGLELATPSPPGPMAKAHHKFDLQPAPPKDFAKWNPKLEY